jgi:HK97 family phage major capsid protein
MLTDHERHLVFDFNKNFYNSRYSKAVIDDSTSGGENAIPEFFDYDLIVTPTLAQENLMSYCNVVTVPRGVAAQNFTMGRPTFAAATSEGTGNEVSLFSTSGFIANHDTSFFRAAGFIELGMNFVEDANPRIVSEIQNQYMETCMLWFNEQITNGDGTTEPQGIKNDSGTTDVTPATPTTGDPTIGDYLELYFGVNKEYRLKGGLQNAVFIMTDTTYQRARSIATGVTGDTRLIFGQEVGDYKLFGQPVLIEENGMGNNDAIFCQMKGYRLYLRQGCRFIREDRGDQLTRANSMLIGADVRAGGQLDLPGYAAVIDGFKS